MEETAADCVSLKQLRRRVLKVTQKDLGEHAGVSAATLSTIECGLKPADEHVPALARAYGVSVDEFWRLFRKEGPRRGSDAIGVAGGVTAVA